MKRIELHVAKAHGLTLDADDDVVLEHRADHDSDKWAHAPNDFYLVGLDEEDTTNADEEIVEES
jgi:hypothetical protein